MSKPSIPESRQTDDRLDEETERLITGLTVAAVAWGESPTNLDKADRELERKMDSAESALRSRIRELVEEARKGEIAFRNLRDRNLAEANRDV